MRHPILFLAAFFSLCMFYSCVADPSSPGGKLGAKNYYGNFTMGVTSGTAYTYLNATGDTLVDLRYSLNSGPSITISNATLKDSSGYYTINKSDAVGTLHGITPGNFQTLSWQYSSGGNNISFNGNKIQ